MKKYNKSWYSVIVSVMIIWFLIVLTAGIFNLVLLELKDTRWESNYLKAFAAAEWAWELALLKIKQEWYAYKDSIEETINNRSIVLATNPINTSSFNKAKDMYISYDFNYTVNSYDWDLAPAWYDIIPLFYTDDAWEHKSRNIRLSLVSWDPAKLTWNIIWENNGISGVGNFSSSTAWEWRLRTWAYSASSVGNFLDSSSMNYLVLFNIDPDNHITYILDSNNPWEFFTKPRTDIITSAQISKRTIILF